MKNLMPQHIFPRFENLMNFDMFFRLKFRPKQMNNDIFQMILSMIPKSSGYQKADKSKPRTNKGQTNYNRQFWTNFWSQELDFRIQKIIQKRNFSWIWFSTSYHKIFVKKMSIIIFLAFRRSLLWFFCFSVPIPKISWFFALGLKHMKNLMLKHIIFPMIQKLVEFQFIVEVI